MLLNLNDSNTNYLGSGFHSPPLEIYSSDRQKLSCLGVAPIGFGTTKPRSAFTVTIDFRLALIHQTFGLCLAHLRPQRNSMISSDHNARLGTVKSYFKAKQINNSRDGISHGNGLLLQIVDNKLCRQILEVLSVARPVTLPKTSPLNRAVGCRKSSSRTCCHSIGKQRHALYAAD
jgi:hypothetical protein